MEFDRQIPIYQQIKDRIIHNIASGYYQPGQVLPSRREMAKTLKINPNTVQRAFSELEKTGVINTPPQKPSRVTEDEEIIAKLRSQIAHQAVQTFHETIAPLGYTREEIFDIFNNYISQEGSDESDRTK